jgi:hypothetical protein
MRVRSRGSCANRIGGYVIVSCSNVAVSSPVEIVCLDTHFLQTTDDRCDVILCFSLREVSHCPSYTLLACAEPNP